MWRKAVKIRVPMNFSAFLCVLKSIGGAFYSMSGLKWSARKEVWLGDKATPKNVYLQVDK